MKYAILGLILLILVTSTWAGTIVYDFEDARQFNAWRDITIILFDSDREVEWVVANGELVVISKDICDLASGYIFGDENWQDYEFEYNFKIEQTFPPAGCETLWGTAVGGLVHYQTTGQRTRVFSGPHSKRVDGLWDINVSGTLVGHSVPQSFESQVNIQERKWYTIRIVAAGNHYQVFLDDKPVIEFDGLSSEYAKGAPGLATRNCEVHFDNLVITGKDIPETLTPVSPGAKITTTWGQIRMAR